MLPCPFRWTPVHTWCVCVCVLDRKRASQATLAKRHLGHYYDNNDSRSIRIYVLPLCARWLRFDFYFVSLNTVSVSLSHSLHECARATALTLRCCWPACWLAWHWNVVFHRPTLIVHVCVRTIASAYSVVRTVARYVCVCVCSCKSLVLRLVVRGFVVAFCESTAIVVASRRRRVVFYANVSASHRSQHTCVYENILFCELE